MSKKQITHMLMERILKWYEHFENSLKILIKLSMQLPFDSANVLLDVFPKELKFLVQVKNKKTCAEMFIAVLFLMASIWKHPNVFQGVSG